MKRHLRNIVAAVLMATVGAMAMAYNDQGGSEGGVTSNQTVEEVQALLQEYRQIRLVAQHQHQEVPPGPTTAYRTITELMHLPGYSLLTLVLDFAPGAWTPLHMHGAEGLVTVLEGVMTLRVEGEEEQTFGPGESWAEHVGLPHAAGNNTDTPARITVSFVLPEGAELTTVLE